MPSVAVTISMFLSIVPAPPDPPRLWQATHDGPLKTGPRPSPPWLRGSSFTQTRSNNSRPSRSDVSEDASATARVRERSDEVDELERSRMTNGWDGSRAQGSLAFSATAATLGLSSRGTTCRSDWLFWSALGPRDFGALAFGAGLVCGAAVNIRGSFGGLSV